MKPPDTTLRLSRTGLRKTKWLANCNSSCVFYAAPKAGLSNPSPGFEIFLTAISRPIVPPFTFMISCAFLACSQHTSGRNNTSITHHYTSVAYSSVAIPTVWSSCSNIISVHDTMVSHSICSSFISISKRERSEIADRTSRPGPGQEDCLKPVGTSKSSSFI